MRPCTASISLVFLAAIQALAVNNPISSYGRVRWIRFSAQYLVLHNYCCSMEYREVFAKFFKVFAKFFKVFASFLRFSRAFRGFRIHSDPLGCIRMHSEAIGSVWTFSKNFEIFWIFESFFNVSGRNFYKRLFSRHKYDI